MTAISQNNARRFAKIKAWQAGTVGQEGKARLVALGVLWPRGNRPDLVVEALRVADRAPALPPLEAFRDKASFIAGALWMLSWAKRRSEGR